MPRFGTINPQNQEPERAQLVEMYMCLRSQQTSVQRRLSLPPSPSSTSTGVSLSYDNRPSTPISPSSEASSPTLSRRRSPRSPSFQPPLIPSVASIPEASEAEEAFVSDESKLMDIERRIYLTLTALLECESVKIDPRMKSWVESRLNDVVLPNTNNIGISMGVMPMLTHPSHRRTGSVGNIPYITRRGTIGELPIRESVETLRKFSV